MLETKGNLWDSFLDATVITTNGFIKKNGECVMGRGCAKEAAEFNSGLPKMLGDKIKRDGNHVHFFGFNYGVDLQYEPFNLITFPVKHNWYEKADIELIERSAKELVEMIDSFDGSENVDYIEINSVAMPRPGCGNGQLNWDDVRPILEKYLDDRFTIYDY